MPESLRGPSKLPLPSAKPTSRVSPCAARFGRAGAGKGPGGVSSRSGRINLASLSSGLPLTPAGDSVRQVASITLNRTLTGSILGDDRSGDEGLLVVIEPRDSSGQNASMPRPRLASWWSIRAAGRDLPGGPLGFHRRGNGRHVSPQRFQQAIRLTTVWPGDPPSIANCACSSVTSLPTGENPAGRSALEVVLPAIKAAATSPPARRPRERSGAKRRTRSGPSGRRTGDNPIGLTASLAVLARRENSLFCRIARRASSPAKRPGFQSSRSCAASRLLILTAIGTISILLLTGCSETCPDGNGSRLSGSGGKRIVAYDGRRTTVNAWMRIGSTAYLILAGLVIILSLLLALLTWEHRRYVAELHARPAPPAHRPGGVVRPCKGLDLDLEANLAPCWRQDYDNYEVTFIVESTDDPAYPAIRRAMAASSRGAGARGGGRPAPTDSGQKVHNLLRGHRTPFTASSTWRLSIPTPGPGPSGCGCWSRGWSGPTWGR